MGPSRTTLASLRTLLYHAEDGATRRDFVCVYGGTGNKSSHSVDDGQGRKLGTKRVKESAARL